MRNLLILLFLISFSIVLGWEFDIDSELYYNSNILNLSDTSLDDFADNVKPEKFEIESSDDFITNLRLKLQHKNYLTGHTQNNRFIIKYNKYWWNNIKDNIYVGYEFQQFFSSKINLEAGYYYYPELYVNNYRSNIESSTDYRKFTYGKNVFKAELFYKFRKNFSAKYRVDYSQLYHNKYFTDYDAKELGNRMEVRYYLSQKVRIIFSYNYTISEQIGDNEDFIKKIDASYESDTYYLSIRLPLHYRDIYFYNNTEFENRYYSSKFVEDTFHIGRNDKFWTHEVNLTLDITKRIRGKFFYEIKRRFTDSYYEYVEDEKNYQTYKIGIGFSTNFK